MIKLIRQVLSQKKYSIPLAIILFFILGAGVYSINSIQENLQKMAAAATELSYDYFPPYPPVNASGKNIALIKRGEYLTQAGDCIACHTNTAAKGKPFAGGFAMPTPFGTIYSPNITPDKETGIGNWTEAQFAKAMHTGISPSGSYYFPAFPYYYFSKISADDLKAIKAYLDSIPAVKQVNPENTMMKPFNIRFLQLGWRLLFFRGQNSEVYHPNPKESAQWNRGAYLVDGLGHCAMCHSPSYYILTESISLGAPIHKYDLTGAKVNGYLAPNITKSNLATVSSDEIVKVFTDDKLVGGGKVEGPMREVNHDSLKYLSPSDLEAIAIYLKSVQSEMPPKPNVGSSGAGKALYENYCSGCHATGAGGAPKYGDATSWAAPLKNGKDTMYSNAIHGIGGMPAKGTCLSCSDDEIKQAVDYMLASVTGSTIRVSAPKPKALTPADNKRIYEANCSICHNTGFKGAPKPGDIQAWQPIIKAGFIETYQNVVTGRNGHPIHGACPTCSDGELIAAIKYMMQQSTTLKDYNLW